MLHTVCKRIFFPGAALRCNRLSSLKNPLYPMFNKLIIACVLCSVLISCKKENAIGSKPSIVVQSEGNNFVFGYYYLFRSPYANVYKLENQQLFPDLVDNIDEPLLFSPVAVSNDKFLIAKKVQDKFPSFLESSTDSTFGLPNSFDQGVLYVEKTTNGIKRSWKIDPDTKHLPSQLQAYASELMSVVNELQ